MPKNVIERILKERLEFSITGTVTEATSRQRELIGNFETLKSDYFYLKNLQRSQQEDLVLLNTAASIDHTEQAARQVFEDQLNDIVRYPNGRLMLSRVEQLIRTEDSSKPFKVLITDHGHNEYNFERTSNRNTTVVDKNRESLNKNNEINRQPTKKNTNLNYDIDKNLILEMETENHLTKDIITITPNGLVNSFRTKKDSDDLSVYFGYKSPEDNIVSN